MAFKYQRRSSEDIEKRANQKGGDFIDIIKSEFRLYKARSGENEIRFLPPTWDKATHYGLDIYAHYDVGPDRAVVLCLRNYPKAAAPPFGKGKCPLCEERLKADNSGDTETSKALKPRRRTLAWVLDRKDDRAMPAVYNMPWTLDRDITKITKERGTAKWIEIDHNEDGRDIFFDKEGERLNTEYVGISMASRSTIVDQRSLDYISENPLPEVLDWRDADELRALYEGNVPEDPADEPHERERPRSAEREERGGRRAAPRDEPDEPERDNRAGRSNGHVDEDDDPPIRDRRDRDDRPRRARAEEEPPPPDDDYADPADEPEERPRRASVRDEPEERPRRASARDEPEEQPRRASERPVTGKSRRDEPEDNRTRGASKASSTDSSTLRERMAQGRASR